MAEATMTSDDFEKARILQDMAGAWFKEFSPESLKMIVRAIHKYPVESIQKAAEVLIIESKRLPTIADLTDQAENFTDWAKVRQSKGLDSERKMTKEEHEAWLKKMDEQDAGL